MGTATQPVITVDPFEPYSVPEMVRRVGDAAAEKAAQPLPYVLRAACGGAMVAFGVLLSLMVSAGITVPGLTSLLMGLAFGFSFVLIMVSGMSLITADMAAGMIAVLQRRLGVGAYLRFLTIGMIGNILGAGLFTAIVAAAGGPYLQKPFLAHAYAVGITKSGAHGLSAILLAVLCTWFLQTAMCLYFKARTDVARMAFAFYGPLAFVAGGTQHVIANVGFIGLPLLLHAWHSHIPLGPSAAITWGLGSHGLLLNLLLTTVGNFIGGTVLVALPFYLVAQLQTKRHRQTSWQHDPVPVSEAI